jgi:hypothetical protein
MKGKPPPRAELGRISESVKVEDGEGGTKHIEHVLTIKPVPGLEVLSLSGVTCTLGQAHTLRGISLLNAASRKISTSSSKA